ncbi:MAG: hypothetical protein KM310_11285 [Clostridiales bacterium]|nr:hypothetical protein [Clostridiales bacterium]
MVAFIFSGLGCGGGDPKEDALALFEEVNAKIDGAMKINHVARLRWLSFLLEEDVTGEEVDEFLRKWQDTWRVAESQMKGQTVPSSLSRNQREELQKGLRAYREGFAALDKGFQLYIDARTSQKPVRKPAYDMLFAADSHFEEGHQALLSVAQELDVPFAPREDLLNLGTDILFLLHPKLQVEVLLETMDRILFAPYPDWAEKIRARLLAGDVTSIPVSELERYVAFAEEETQRRINQVAPIFSAPMLLIAGERTTYERLMGMIQEVVWQDVDIAREVLAFRVADTAEEQAVHLSKLREIAEQRNRTFDDFLEKVDRFLDSMDERADPQGG